MKQFLEVQFDYRRCRAELNEFRDFLAGNPVLDERRQILPFFRDRVQLSALCGIFNPNISNTDQVAREFELFGDFRCDLVVGDSAKGAFCFVEFEDAGEESIFRKQGRKATREWSPRFDHGFSQVLDWFCKIRDLEKTDALESKFGKRPIDYEGLLVIGRAHHLDLGEVQRLEWRRKHVLVDSKRIHCVTYDQLLGEFETRLRSLELVAEALGSSDQPPLTGG